MVEKDYALSSISIEILRLLWDLADQTRLVPTLLKCGLAKRVIGWLAQSAMLTDESRKPLISIVHNIARHDDGVDELNKHGAIDVIETMDSRILVISMTLAFLSSPEQLKRDKKGMNAVLNQLLQLVMDSAKSDQYRYDGFHVSEPLEVLVKMFVVEERTLDYVLCHAETEPTSDMSSTVHLFISLLFSFSNALKGTDRLEQFTLVALLNILWSISFQPNYAQELAKDEKLIEIIQKFAENDKDQDIIEQYKPRSMESIKQATNGILHNVNRNYRNDVKPNQQETVLNASVVNPVECVNNKPSIMISYSHDNNTFCSKILNLLTTRNDNFDIWIDRTHCQGANDLWEMIANGIESACVIVCLLSTQYFESKSCRQEFIYANDSLKKKIVHVLLDNFEPKGWLGK
ncbi:unnamed protein product [Rotaria sp. Silwood2]|nr:unnamed protein product [Rotaria sp. Silwood2]